MSKLKNTGLYSKLIVGVLSISLLFVPVTSCWTCFSSALKPSESVCTSHCQKGKEEHFMESTEKLMALLCSPPPSGNRQLQAALWAIVPCQNVQHSTAECVITVCAPIVKCWLHSMILLMTDVGIFLTQLVFNTYLSEVLLNTSHNL